MLIIAITMHNQKNCKTYPFHESYSNKNSNFVNSFSNSLTKYCKLLNSTDEKAQIKSNQWMSNAKFQLLLKQSQLKCDYCENDTPMQII
jgi:hypothetical protein